MELCSITIHCNLDIKTRVLVANLIEKKNNKENKNAKSIVFKLEWNAVSVLMTGDFEGSNALKEVKRNLMDDNSDN